MTRSNYVNDGNYAQDQRASLTVHDDRPSARITYRGEDGERFRVNVIQRANPVGFRARLPGDKKGQ